jgi:hypothetical protein
MSARAKVVGRIGAGKPKIHQRMVQLKGLPDYSAFFAGNGQHSAEWFFDWGWLIKDMDVDKDTGIGWVLLEHGTPGVA